MGSCRCFPSGRAGSGRRRLHRHAVPADLPPVFINERHTKGPAGFPVLAENGGPARAGKVIVAPLLERAEHHPEFPAGGREAVLLPRSSPGLLVGVTDQHAVVDQGRQPVSEHVRGDAQVLAELRETRHPPKRLPEHQEGPPFAHDTEGASDRAIGIECLGHGNTLPSELYIPTHTAKFVTPTQGREPFMEINGATALVTGANRGLGRHLAEQLRDRGATVYAAARQPESVDLPGLIPVALDITDPGSLAAAVQTARGISILVNNAGSATGASLLTGDLADIRLEMDTHYFGTLAVVRAFAPQLAEHQQSAVLNVLSVLSWVSFPDVGAYCAAKSAEWSLTNALRQELASQGTRVSALHVGFMDTDMTRHVDAPKANPADIARTALDGLGAGDLEILADDISRQVEAGLAGGVAALYPQIAQASAI